MFYFPENRVLFVTRMYSRGRVPFIPPAQVGVARVHSAYCVSVARAFIRLKTKQVYKFGVSPSGRTVYETFPNRGRPSSCSCLPHVCVYLYFYGSEFCHANSQRKRYDANVHCHATRNKNTCSRRRRAQSDIRLFRIRLLFPFPFFVVLCIRRHARCISPSTA